MNTAIELTIAHKVFLKRKLSHPALYISFKSIISPIDDIGKDTIFYFEFLIAPTETLQEE